VSGPCHKYCCVECRRRAQYARSYFAECAICGKALAPGRQRKKYCSEKCYRVKRASYVDGQRQWAREAYITNKYGFRDRRIASAKQHGRHAFKKSDSETRRFARVVLRDPCVYCGERGGTLDHIEPTSLGGANHWSNMASACALCNSSKRHTRLLLYLAKK
jgi:5-methylcytosine-specific restriction endonuclease McrA